MEVLSRRIGGSGWSTMAAIVVAFVLLMTMVPEASATKYTVGGKMGWSPNQNFTIWARDLHFYTEDWLFFVYDRTQQNVLEVNKTNYELCNSEHPIHNWTTGAGRDVVPLNVTKTFYFISGNGFCYSGMKVAVHVVKTPPPPSASPVKSGVPRLLSTFQGQIIVPTLFTIAAVWDAFLLFL